MSVEIISKRYYDTIFDNSVLESYYSINMENSSIDSNKLYDRYKDYLFSIFEYVCSQKTLDRTSVDELIEEICSSIIKYYTSIFLRSYFIDSTKVDKILLYFLFDQNNDSILLSYLNSDYKRLLSEMWAYHPIYKYHARFFPIYIFKNIVDYLNYMIVFNSNTNNIKDTIFYNHNSNSNNNNYPSNDDEAYELYLKIDKDTIKDSIVELEYYNISNSKNGTKINKYYIVE